MSATDQAPLRILHVSEVHWGGVVTLLEHFVTEQVRAGHEVHVLAPAAMPELGDGVHSHVWAIDRSRPTTLPQALRQLRAAVRDISPDVIHLHSFVAGLVARLPLVLAGLGRVPVVYQPHAWSDDLFPQAALRSAVRLSERLGARRTDLLVANCQDELDRGEALGVHLPGVPLSVAVDLDRFHPPSPDQRAQARRELGLEGRNVALVLGRLTRQKGQDLLLPVWETRPIDGAVLALVGPGESAELETLAPREWGVSILAPGGTDRVLPWLWASDVLVLCSRYETVALVVAEAMSCGLPVVATAVDGVSEVVLSGEEPPAGAVVPLGDMNELLDAVELRLGDEGLRRREAEAGTRRARRLFAPAAVTDRLEHAYAMAIEARNETGSP